MIFSSYTNLNREFCVIFLNHHLPRPEQFKLKTSSQARLIDIRQQGCHLSLAWQLLLKLNHILLDLFALPPQGLKTHCLDQLGLIVSPQRLFLGNFCRQFLFVLFDLYEPQRSSYAHCNEDT